MESKNAPLKSEQLLEEIKRQNRLKEIVDVEQERVKVVLVTVGGMLYAFYGENISEILPAMEISWVPGLPDYLAGLILVRGDVESVMDIAHFLGGERGERQQRLIAMATSDDFRSGILIDTVEDVVDLPCSDVKPPLATLNPAIRDLLCGEIDRNGTITPLLDVRKLAARVTV